MATTVPLITFQIGTELQTISCADCGILFAASTEFVKRRQDDHRVFYCPSGHSNYYGGKSDAETLRDQLAAAKKEAEYQRGKRQDAEESAKHFEARANGYKGQAAKLKKRVAAGTCAYCSRTFANVANHMKSQHPAEHEAALAQDS